MKKSFFLSLVSSVAILAAAFGVQSASAASSGIVSVGGYSESVCYVTSAGGLVLNGSSDTSGLKFVAAAVNTDSNCVGLTDSWELRYFNGSNPVPGETFVSLFGSSRWYVNAVTSDGRVYKFAFTWYPVGWVSDSAVSRYSFNETNFSYPYQTAWCRVGIDGSALCKNYFNGTLYSGTDVADAQAWWPSYSHGWAVLKKDGSVLSETAFDGTYSQISVGWDFGGTDGYRVCAVRTNGLVICKSDIVSWLESNKPTFPVRDVAVGSDSAYAVKVSDNTLWKWNASGLSQVGSSTVGGSSGGSTSFDATSNYCVDFGSGSHAYDFVPVKSSGDIVETVPTFWFSDYFKVGSRQYDFRNLEFERGAAFSGMLRGSSSGSVVVSPGSWFSPVDSYIDVKSRDWSSVNYLRLYGSGASTQSGVAFDWLGTPTEFVSKPATVEISMIFPDGSTSVSTAPESAAFTDYVKYTGSDSIVGWRIRFKPEDVRPSMSLNGIEIGYVDDYPSASWSCSTDGDRVSSVTGSSPSGSGSTGGVLQDALNGVTTSTGVSLGPLQDALNGSGTATGVSLGPLQDALNGSSVSDVSRINDVRASIAWSIGNYYSGVVLDDPVKKTCKMFSNTGKFLYKSNGKPFFVGVNFVSLSDNSIVRRLLWYVQKGQTIVLEPFNLVLSSFSALGTVPDNTSVCFLGTAYVVQYQQYVAPPGQTVTSFHSLDAYKPVKGTSTFLDFLALFVFYVVIGSGLYLLSKPSA